MAVFRIEKTRDYTVMSNYHLRDMSLSLKAKGLLSLMLSLPENWDYTMKGLARICKDGIDSISGGIRELEAHGYLIRSRVRSANGQLGSIEYTILEQPKAPSPTQEKPIRENPVQANPILDAPIQENPAQLNKEESIKTTQYNAYIEKLTKCTNEFYEILDDLEPAINLIRKENRSLDVILDDIKEKESTLETIKKDFNYSSIPEGCMSYYNSLNNTFTLYSTYLNSLKIAVIYEKSSPSYEENKDTIDKNYDNAYSKYDDVKTSFESLLNSF